MRILAAMSGGVDSSVAALRLLEEGHEVIGLFMRSGVEAPLDVDPHRQGCCSAADAQIARGCAGILGIPFYALNFEDDFGRIIEDFVNAYAAGRTPNPCVRCNDWLKFGHLLDFARSVGAEAVATGHYADILVAPSGRRALCRPKDRDKDQTYYLAGLTQEQLEWARFPLANLEKSEVRSLAKKHGFPNAYKPESQEICFVPSGNYRSLVRDRRPDAMAPGEILDRSGKILGRHDGVAGFTIGQRRGLGISSEKPLYVLELDPAARTVVVGGREELASGGLVASGMNWMGASPPEVGESFSCRVQIRYRHRAVGASIACQERDRIEVYFEERQDAVTPGQTLVLYDLEDRVVLARGTIEGKNR
ncbi:MAG: tRNA 2-thiouridine(34) synthase MnmA [Planctomycetota bacterium]|jgi:tRNA-specific 2-thiouridylase|nr:tRNA 2-thiouridine(34) synthase MnmA [Planctomycetota bacterium]